MKFLSIITVQGLALPILAAALPGAAPNASPVHLTARATCALHTQWEPSWRDGGYDRYRVRAWAEGYSDAAGWHGTRIMLEKWCQSFRNVAGHYGAGLENPQCWLENDNLAYADISTFIGSHGHDLYKGMHQETVNQWRDWSKYTCDVDSRH
ncbi:hypothetical protein B0T14DRAFT_563921 [Immersiella caudata]|uniref:Uncharacterized protein n=1 Tax=Immersiella caudata TaxID=314043 RepID=A0AA39WVQ4_9PEZI|nr:hypothetical protein B0T14DRAFT_563921 [Immersiella caudata]